MGKKNSIVERELAGVFKGFLDDFRESFKGTGRSSESL